MDGIGILDGDQVVADLVDDAAGTDGTRRILQQECFECLVDPGAGDHLRTDMRPDFGLEMLDDLIDGLRIKIAFLGKHRFERAHAALHVAQVRSMVMVVIVIVIVIVMIVRRVMHCLFHRFAESDADFTGNRAPIHRKIFCPFVAAVRTVLPD
jgi:hypothetical protein